jgi:chromosomal replication initiator protein
VLVTGVFQFPVDFEKAPGSAALRSSSSDAFVAGPENWMLHHALHRILNISQPVLSSPENPVVFWGPSGTGKSLLLHRLAECWAHQRPAHRIRTTLAADWARAESMEQASDSNDAKRGSTEALSAKSVPLRFDDQVTTALFLDDVHQLAGRTTAQLRLADAIDEIGHKGGMVVVTSRSHPASISALHQKLVSRLMSGLSLEIFGPGLQAKMVIVQKLALRSGWRLSSNAAEFAARRIDGGVRELRQSLSRCFPVRPFPSEPISIPELTSRLTASEAVNTTPREIQTIVARQYRLTVASLQSPSRRRNVVSARAVAMYLVRRITHLPLKTIGHLFGGRDHTTVIHACRKVDEQLQHNTELHRFIQETMTKLRLRS